MKTVRSVHHRKCELLKRAILTLLVLCIISTASVTVLGAFNAAAVETLEPSNEELLNDTVEHLTELTASSVQYSAPREEPTVTLLDQPAQLPTWTAGRTNTQINSYDTTTNYAAKMKEMLDLAVSEGNPDYYLGLGEVYEVQRNLKVLGEGLDIKQTHYFDATNSLDDIYAIYYPDHRQSYMKYTEAELYRVAAIVSGEAGSDICTTQHQRDVASVIVNRVNDPRFPNTIEGVIMQDNPVQYATRYNRTYPERALANARYVLENGPTHNGVWQAGFPQGKAVLAVYDYGLPGYEVTYICS